MAAVEHVSTRGYVSLLQCGHGGPNNFWNADDFTMPHVHQLALHVDDQYDLLLWWIGSEVALPVCRSMTTSSTQMSALSYLYCANTIKSVLYLTTQIGVSLVRIGVSFSSLLICRPHNTLLQVCWTWTLATYHAM